MGVATAARCRHPGALVSLERGGDPRHESAPSPGLSGAVRVVRDFFDRVTARALGGESMLSPRLPSLFEPQRNLATGFAEEVSEVVAPAVQPSMPVERMSTPRREMPVSPAKAVAQEPVTSRPATKEAPRRMVRHGVDVEPAHVTSTMHSKAVTANESLLSPSRRVVESVERPIPSAHVQREWRAEALPVNESRRATDEGSLLAPTQPVFRTPPAPTSTAARLQGAHVAQGMQSAASHEPVVHVSIGRLEVRAAPSPGKVTQRPDASRPSPLDDYLRERGKASP